jgi:hypothetical protein
MEFDVRSESKSDLKHRILFADVLGMEEGDAYYVTTGDEEAGVRIKGFMSMIYINEEDIDNCISALKKAQALRKLGQGG